MPLVVTSKVQLLSIVFTTVTDMVMNQYLFHIVKVDTAKNYYSSTHQ